MMFMKTITTAVVATFALLSGCATNNATQQVANLSDQPTGLLVGSVSIPNIDSNVGINLRYYFQRVDTSSEYIVEEIEEDYDIDFDYSAKPDTQGLQQEFVVSTTQLSNAMFSESEFEQQDGKVFSVELPAGTYQLTRWSMSTAANTQIHPRNLAPIEFVVEADKVNYLGNIHMELQHEADAFGVEIAQGSPVIFQDKSERDIQVLKSKGADITADMKKIVPATHSWVKSKSSMNGTLSLR